MFRKMREMVGGCCVCSDERGWDENPLVYCDGQGCNVAVHQACYGIVTVPTGPWFCRKCESQERAARVRCELCPNRDGGLKRTDTNSWAHVVCALYIPEVRFGNVSTMEPIILGLVPQERYQKVCYLCENQGRGSRAASGACMQCNKSGCKSSFHVTCAQRAGLLCEEAGNYSDNVKYCGYCEFHYQRINKKVVKTVPAFKPVASREPSGESDSIDDLSDGDNEKFKDASKRGKKGRRPLNSESSISSGDKGVTEAKPSDASRPPASATPGKAAGAATDSEKKNPFSSKSSSSGTSSKDSSFGSSSSSLNTLTPEAKNGTIAGADSKQRPPESRSSTSSTIPSDSTPNTSATKTPSVIVKFGKQDGTYYSKKDTIYPSSLTITSSSSTTSSLSLNHSSSSGGGTSSAGVTISATGNSINSSDTKKDKGKDKLKRSREEAGITKDSDSKKQPVDLGASEKKSSDKSSSSSQYKSEQRSKSSQGSNGTRDHRHHHHRDHHHHRHRDYHRDHSEKSKSGGSSSRGEDRKMSKTDSKDEKFKTSECTVALDKTKIDLRLNSQVTVTASATKPGPTLSNKPLSATTAAAAASVSAPSNATASAAPPAATTVTSPSKIEVKKDSPAKILPISASSSSPSGSFGKPLKVETNHSSGNASRTSSLEVSPVKVDKPASAVARDYSPPRVTQDVKLGSGQQPQKRTASGKRLGRPPKKGTHLHSNSLGASASSPTKGDSRKRSPTGSPGRGDDDGFAKRKKKSAKRLTNGDGKLWMMGARLNPSSEVAKEMDTVLKNEIQAHSVYDPSAQPSYHGVPLPGSKRNRAAQKSSASSTTTNSSQDGKATCQPQTLDELLERQWEQGSQFLMDQASHFDIASLLSSLHQLKEESLDLEESVDRMVQRRDHLLAVRARLLALSSLTVATPTQSNPGSTPSSNQVTPERAASTATTVKGPSPSVPNGPSSVRSAPHVSPRNAGSSAATVSPIRSGSAMISSRNLPPPPPASGVVNATSVVPIQHGTPSSSATIHMQPLPPPAHSPRDRHGPLPQSHHQLPSPRERPQPPASSPRQLPPLPPSPRDSRVSPRSGMVISAHMENGIDYHRHGTPPGPPPHGAIPVSSPSNMGRRGPSPSAHEGDVRSGIPPHLLTVAGGPPAHNQGPLPPPPPSHMQGRPINAHHPSGGGLPPPPRQSTYGMPTSGGMMNMPPRSSPHSMPPSGGMSMHPHHSGALGGQRPPIVSSQVSVGPHHGGGPSPRGSMSNMMVRPMSGVMDGRPPPVSYGGPPPPPRGGAPYHGMHTSMNMSVSQAHMMRQGASQPRMASMHHDKR